MLIVDTAGRLHVDDEMMSEIKKIDSKVHPHQRLFVVDSMAGQDALNSAKAFHEALDLTIVGVDEATEKPEDHAARTCAT